MAFSFEVDGLDQMIQKMGKIPETAGKIAAEALYEGAASPAASVPPFIYIDST